MSMTKAVDKKIFVEAKQKKAKLKKNALEHVDKDFEAKIDPKFKTELCKSWVETKFCVYGNKCRFAHGKDEIFNKNINKTKYKLKDCSSFFQNGQCNYGSRCHFKHDERHLNEIKLPFYSIQVLLTNYVKKINSQNNELADSNPSRRLKVFKNLHLCGSEPIITTRSTANGVNVDINNDFLFNNCNGIKTSNLDTNTQVNKSNEIEFHTRILSHFY